MKKILFTLIILFAASFCQAAENINITDYLDKPYVGMAYNEALTKEIPFLLVFVNPANIVYLAKFGPIGEMVYNEFKGQYNFCVINSKNKENKDLVKFFDTKNKLALYLIDPVGKTYTYVDKRYYNKRDMREILTKFKEGTVSAPSSN